MNPWLHFYLLDYLEIIWGSLVFHMSIKNSISQFSVSFDHNYSLLCVIYLFSVNVLWLYANTEFFVRGKRNLLRLCPERAAQLDWGLLVELERELYFLDYFVKVAE